MDIRVVRHGLPLSSQSCKEGGGPKRGFEWFMDEIGSIGNTVMRSRRDRAFDLRFRRLQGLRISDPTAAQNRIYLSRLKMAVCFG